MYLSKLKNLFDTAALRQQYAHNSPFPHIVLDDFFNYEDLLKIEEMFPPLHEGSWWTYNNPLERKFARNDIHNFPFSLQYLIYELQSNLFVSFVESVTNINGLIVDHTLNGGGIHQTIRNGKLDLHADYNYHPITKLDRRVNVLIYLNSNWEEEWGGHLELYKSQTSINKIRTYLPILGRMVIFSVNDDAIHGQPDPLQCPFDRTRKSIALYYYTNGRPAEEVSPAHSTIFVSKPGEPVDLELEKLRRLRAKKRIT